MLSHRLDTFFSYPSPATVAEKIIRKRTLGKWSLSSVLDGMALPSQIHSLLPREMKPCVLRGLLGTQRPTCLLAAQHHLLHLLFDACPPTFSLSSLPQWYLRAFSNVKQLQLSCSFYVLSSLSIKSSQSRLNTKWYGLNGREWAWKDSL